MKRLMLASTSTLHGEKYLEYLLPELKTFLGEIDELLFIPYAQPGGVSYDEYTLLVKSAFSESDINVLGIHEYESSLEAIKVAKSIFVGGGNTFKLVSKLYEEGLMDILNKTVENGTPYIGTSAGSNIAGVSMKNTNDMPIRYPPSFETLKLINFNLNPHYLDSDPKTKHMGESRETRIKEFHAFNNTPVLGLREGSWLEVIDASVVLKGKLPARLFLKDKPSVEISPNVDIGYL